MALVTLWLQITPNPRTNDANSKRERMKASTPPSFEQYYGYTTGCFFYVFLTYSSSTSQFVFYRSTKLGTVLFVVSFYCGTGLVGCQSRVVAGVSSRTTTNQHTKKHDNVTTKTKIQNPKHLAEATVLAS